MRPFINLILLKERRIIRNMRDSKRGLSIKLQLIVLTVLFSSSCALKGTAGGCSTSTQAQITVYDSSISRDCGCAEGSATFGAGSTNFVCTVKQGTTLFIIYNTQNDHQIIFTQGYGIAPQIYTAGSSATSGAVSFLSTSAGVSFSDIDSGASGVSGVFIVTAN